MEEKTEEKQGEAEMVHTLELIARNNISIMLSCDP